MSQCRLHAGIVRGSCGIALFRSETRDEICFKDSRGCLKLSIDECFTEVLLATQRDRGKVLSRFIPAILLGGILSLSSVLFQNCAGYSATKDGILTTDGSSVATACSGNNLTCSDLNNVQLAIANQDPILVTGYSGGSNGSCDSSTCVDVAGYCDASGFTSNRISASITGTVSLPDTVLGSCDANGRFRLLLPMPTGFVTATTYTVTVIMRIYDANGSAYENPSGLNRKTITLTSTTQ